MNIGIILVIVVVLLALYLTGTYNGFVVLKQRIQEAFSGIDVQLKRRADLIPNLVETVKGYATHEAGVFEKVTQARADAINAKALSLPGFLSLNAGIKRNARWFKTGNWGFQNGPEGVLTDSPHRAKTENDPF